MEEEESADSSEAANDSNKPETGKADASVNGNGDGNGQVPPGQTEDENGNIVNGGGNMAPGLNRGNKLDKPDNPNKPSKPEKVPSRFMRKFICRLRLNEVSRQ